MRTTRESYIKPLRDAYARIAERERKEEEAKRKAEKERYSWR